MVVPNFPLDTLGFGGGDENLYRYINNGPTDGRDPSGQLAILEFLAKTSVQTAIHAGCTAAETVLSGRAGDWTAWAGNAASLGVSIGVSKLVGSQLAMRVVTKAVVLGALGPTLAGVAMLSNVSRTYTAYADWQNGNGNAGLFLTRFACTGIQIGIGAASFRNVLSNVNGNQIKVSSWADPGKTPDLASNRWVVVGTKSFTNFLKTGLWGPKADGIKVDLRSFPFIRVINFKAPSFDFKAKTDYVDISRVTQDGVSFFRQFLGQFRLL